jgi:Cof subfamily protein (haloacid dehalogenase superfamily)
MTQHRPRLVATDLDGTLVRSDRTVSPYTVSVLAQLEDAGVPVVFVTGRPLRWTRPVFDYVGSHGLAIVSNGALVWDVHDDLARLEREMAVEVARDAADRIREAVPGSAFGVETVHGFGVEPGFRQSFQIEQVPVGPLDDHLSGEDGPVLKLLARHEELAPDAFAKAATEAVGDLATVTHSSDRVSLLEISALGVTKASTLAMVAAELGVGAEEVVAFGDMPNDIAMLSWAGTAYAMADAHPRVLSCATHVAPGHDDDGVARTLAEIFGL